MAQPPTLGRIGLDHRIRPSVINRERDDGPREPVVHARLLRRDPRDTETMVADVLARTAAAGSELERKSPD
jgi:hypothetical protein